MAARTAVPLHVNRPRAVRRVQPARAKSIDDAASIRDAIAATDYASIVGPISFKKGPFPNVCRTPLVIGQWQKGKKFPFDLVNVDNTTAKDIPTAGKVSPVG